MSYQKTATPSDQIKMTPENRTPTDYDDAVVSLKGVAQTMLRTQDPRSMLHVYISALRRDKRALGLVDPKAAPAEQRPLLKIAVAAIGNEVSSAKMALISTEESLREAYTYKQSLQSDSALSKAAGLVLLDYEAERLTMLGLMNEVRDLWQSFQVTLNQA